jgi:Phage integrase family
VPGLNFLFARYTPGVAVGARTCLRGTSTVSIYSIRSIRVTAKPDLGFFPKRWEERKVPAPVRLANILIGHPQPSGSVFMFPRRPAIVSRIYCVSVRPSPSKQALMRRRSILKTFRSTYATRMLRQSFDVRTVQDWMGHKSLETMMRYLVPATDVHDRLDEIEIPGVTESAVPKKAPGSERLLVAPQKKDAAIDRSHKTLSTKNTPWLGQPGG